MSDHQYTRCPVCKTVFRVTSAQLAVRAGQVRCGQCKTVFDGVAELLPVVPPAPEASEYDEATMGPPTMTLRAPQPATASITPDRAPDMRVASRFAWADDHGRSKRATAYALGVPLLVVLLGLQALFHYRDAVAAHWPAVKPALVRACAVLGCTIEPVRDIDEMAIDASDLQADPAHRGLLILSATLRNRSGLPLAYPYLELTLTDAKDQVVARRALQPAEYLNGTADAEQGIAPNGEVPVKLFIDASATSQAGYRLWLFYP